MVTQILPGETEAKVPGAHGLMVTQILPGETAAQRWEASLAPRPGDEPSWLPRFCLEKQQRSSSQPKGLGISARTVTVFSL
jgi:hypothetical protein